MWEYHGVDHNNDFLQHWKYTRREMKNGRWQYYYDNGKNTVPHAQVKARQNNNAGYRRGQTHGKVSKQTRNNIAVTNSKRTAGEEIKSGINRRINYLKLKGRNFYNKYIGPTKTTTTTTKNRDGSTTTTTTTGNKIFSRTSRSTTAGISTSNPKMRKRRK